MESDLRYHPETPRDLAEGWPPFYKAVALSVVGLLPEERREIGGEFFDQIEPGPLPHDFLNIPLDLSEICAMDSQTLAAAIETFTPQERAEAEKILEEPGEEF